jgi:hypothetical protein
VRELNVFVSSSFFLARVFVFAKQIACVTVISLKSLSLGGEGKILRGENGDVVLEGC